MLPMHSSSLPSEWILERSSVDQPLEVGNKLGAYNVFLFRVHVALLGAAVDGGNLFVENILEAAACIGSKGGHLGDAAEDEVPECGEELIEDGTVTGALACGKMALSAGCRSRVRRRPPTSTYLCFLFRLASNNL